MVNIVRWTPRTRLSHEPRSMERLFDEVWRDLWNTAPVQHESDTARPVRRPAMDVIEHDEGLTIQIDLPGLSPEQVQVEIESDLLTISGERDTTQEQDKGHFYTRERIAGAFKRSLRLPDTFDTAQAEATFHNGVLTLALPKRPESQPKRIKVETAS